MTKEEAVYTLKRKIRTSEFLTTKFEVYSQGLGDMYDLLMSSGYKPTTFEDEERKQEKLERISAMCLQGLLANPNYRFNGTSSIQNIISNARELLKQLEQWNYLMVG